MTALGIRIAGVRLDIRASGELPPSFERYRRFIDEFGAPRWTVDIRPGASASLDRYTGRLLRRAEGLEVEGLEARGRLDVESRHLEAVTDPHLLAFDGLVRAVIQLEALSLGGCLVHAAAIVVGGRAHLFPGRSGSGKSTLAALAGHALCDELCVVLPSEDGFEVHGTPWWKGRGGSAPLSGLYRLAWEDEAVAPLDRRGALRHLATNLVLPLAGPRETAAAFAAAGRVAAAVPFGRLSFRPDSDVDALLRGAVGHA